MAPATGAGARPDTVEDERLDELVETDVPWVVVVWNDPVNLMSYVVYVFRKVFGYSRDKATRLMLQVHNDGRSAVWSGAREQCEGYVTRLHAHGLWATLQKDR